MHLWLVTTAHQKMLRLHANVLFIFRRTDVNRYGSEVRFPMDTARLGLPLPRRYTEHREK